MLRLIYLQKYDSEEKMNKREHKIKMFLLDNFLLAM